MKFALRSGIFRRMRVSLVLASLVTACAPAYAQSDGPSSDGSSVTINLDALPVPMPRPKPTPEEMRPLAQARPRPKPDIESVSVESVDLANVGPDAPQPRRKPDLEVAAEAPAPEAQPAVRPVAEAVPPTKQNAAAEVPVEILGSPTTDDSIGVEITGIAADPFKKPVNPLEGFAVMSRVRFSNGKSNVTAQARAALDGLAQRLLSTSVRVRLAAFSGRAGDLSSEARRLSLARALAVRSYLVSKGVPVERVDVLAFGGATDGVSDRVDVLVRGI
jgi:outer membrane protein OmpA-like peptidoglycan-associated protein